MSGAPAVTSAQTTIERVWPEHGGHKSSTRHARWSTAEGVVCACGDVLGWPDPEHHETYSQYTKRIAAEQVDAASAPGRVKGAFGTYGGEQAKAAGWSAPIEVEYPGPDGVVEPARKAAGHWPVGATDNPVDVREPGDYPDPEVQEPEGLPAGDGRKAYDDLPYDVPEEDGPPNDPWADTPDDEPEPEPWPAAAVPTDDPVASGDVVTGPVDFAKLADEAQTESDIPPWTDPEVPSNEGIPAERPGGEVAVREEPGVGQEVVPFAGTPIFPTEGQTLDPLVDRLDPLDPTLPYTPEDVELKIVDIMRAIDRSELFLRQQIAREHAAQHNLDFRYNLAIAQSEAKAADQRKAEAWIATERQRFEATEASMLVRALRDAKHNLRSVLSGYQSVARSLGVSLTNSLDGRRPSGPPLPQEPPPDPWTR